nr:extensin family protein [Sphingomonas gellani]
MLAAVAGLTLFALLRGHAEDLPWTPVDLSAPVGMFTGRKLTGLKQDLPACRAAIDAAGVRYRLLPPLRAGQCGYDDAVRLPPGGSRSMALSPSGPGMSCAVAAALSVWEWEVVQPAAQRYFGQPVTSLEHFGTYNCRRIYGRDNGSWSEHATANALDVAGFRLANGRRISVVHDWRGTGKDAEFLRTVRDGACRLFATVLSPDYNAAHRDHLHLDQASRGAMGWRACR